MRDQRNLVLFFTHKRESACKSMNYPAGVWCGIMVSEKIMWLPFFEKVFHDGENSR